MGWKLHLALAALLCWPIIASAVDLTGRASVIDGDTLEIHGQRIQLYGVDAPESRQTCEAEGQTYRCGQQAALAMADHIGQRTVTCEQRMSASYGCVVATCRVAGGDIGSWLVLQGWALAYVRYSRDYVDEELTARTARRGIWRGTFMPPWAWRGRGADATTDKPQSAATCCKVCKTGKASGDSCISSDEDLPQAAGVRVRWPMISKRIAETPYGCGRP